MEGSRDYEADAASEKAYNGFHWPRELLRDLDRISTTSFRSSSTEKRPQRDLNADSRGFRAPLRAPLLTPLKIPDSTPTRTMADPTAENPDGGVSRKKSLILCFDGTGNKFSGTASDSNIVKIYSLLDRSDPHQYHYYQPGIGTYTETSSLSQKSRFGRIKSAYLKAKDQAIGTSFGEHVMAGYKFLMRYYSSGDDIYFFGFSRGAYTARFLAELLDYVGLLSAGNEEMLRFAWKTFALWQMRTDSTDEERAKKKETYRFMKNFRETFSRPIDRIRFIGLFDCVNSVPQFEAAWMTRTKFPYTAKTSARIIRHAVSIDERRAKFRQDLMSDQKNAPDTLLHPFRKRFGSDHAAQQKESSTDEFDGKFRRKARTPQSRLLKASGRASEAGSSIVSVNSATAAQQRTMEAHNPDDANLIDESDVQDILEVWFAGQHGDVGGGWTLDPGEKRPASDIPFIWMLREARKAGMPFDEEKLKSSDMYLDESSRETPMLQLDGQPLNDEKVIDTSEGRTRLTIEDLLDLHTSSKLHDSLIFGGGLTWSAVAAWKFMEYLPFRRMDLQKDGSWKPVSWPLPRGEVRDMPENAIIHGSVIRRMQTDKNYRPGNLIIGGGGRGVRFAPESAGIGNWQVVAEAGNAIGETVIKVLAE